MVLGAGLGTRMRPYTDKVPKPLVPLAGKPLLDHVLDRLALAGVEKAVVNVHYMADQMEDHLRGRATPAIVISDERDLLLDTGGGVKHALPHLGEGDFFIHNSDSVWLEGQTPCLDQMMAAWDPDRMDSLLLLAPVANTLGYSGRGDFDMDVEGRIRRPMAEEEVPFVFTGVSIANAALFKNAPEGPFSLNLLWDEALERGRLYGLRHEGTWMHVGTPDAVKEAEECIAREQG